MRQILIKEDHALLPLDDDGEYFAAVDLDKLHLVQDYNWYRCKGKTSSTSYAVTRHKGKTRRMHRTVLGLENSDLHVDHKDCDGLNNREYNLRKATVQQNACNKGIRKDNKSGYKGVTFQKDCKKPWKAAIYHKGRAIYLGLYDTPEGAYAAYCAAAKKYHGEFANLG